MGILFFLIPLIIILYQGLYVIDEYERGVVLRLGRLVETRNPGLNFLIPFIDRLIKVDLRTITLDVPSQDVITKDNVTIKVNAVVYFKVTDPVKAVVEVENYLQATSKYSQTTLRSVLGQVDLDTLLASRDQINLKLQTLLDERTESWGVKVPNVEVKQIDLPVEMQRAMARQAEAERERRAKVIAADGEFQASLKLTEAAKNMEQQPMSLQLRYLQTIREMSSEKSTTTILPFPIELLRFFSGKTKE